MKRPAGRVANLPVGLYDALAGGEPGFHLVACLVEHLREQSLVILREGQRVPVAGEPFHEILRQVGPAHHSQLAEKRQTAVVQSKHRFRPNFARSAAGGVGFNRLGFQLLRLRQQLRLTLRRQILEDRHPANNPLFGRVVKRTVRALTLPRQSAHAGQRRFKLGDDIRTGQRRLAIGSVGGVGGRAGQGVSPDGMDDSRRGQRSNSTRYKRTPSGAFTADGKGPMGSEAAKPAPISFSENTARLCYPEPPPLSKIWLAIRRQ